MTTWEMLDQLETIYAQIRADQKREEYDLIFVMVEEISSFLLNDLGVNQFAYGEIKNAPFTF